MAPSSPLQLGKHTAGIVGPALAFLVLCCLAYHLRPKPIQFDTVTELKHFVEAKGLVFHCGNAHGFDERNGFVADHLVTFDDLVEVSGRHGFGLTPAWRGMLWVCEVDTRNMTLIPQQFGGTWRVWGNIFVGGDEELMDRIELHWRSQ